MGILFQVSAGHPVIIFEAITDIPKKAKVHIFNFKCSRGKLDFYIVMDLLQKARNP